MKFTKIKRAFAAGIAAVMCAAIALSVPASAKNDDAVWKETKAVAGASYNSSYIKWVEKYSEKDTSKTVQYSKSKTKKFLDKFEENTGKDEPQFVVKFINKDEIVSAAIKGNKYKVAVYNAGIGMAYSGDLKNVTFLDINDEEKCSLATNEALEISFTDTDDIIKEIADDASDILDFDIDDDEKGKLFKFKSGEKTYYYEEFEYDRYNSVGFLFSENGNILAMTNKGDSFCVSVSYKVKDSVFDIPKDYKDVDYTEIDWLS